MSSTPRKIMKNILIFSCSYISFLQARNHPIIIMMDFWQLLLCIITLGGVCIHSPPPPPTTTTAASPGESIRTTGKIRFDNPTHHVESVLIRETQNQFKNY
jgi:hypothetical protein